MKIPSLPGYWVVIRRFTYTYNTLHLLQLTTVYQSVIIIFEELQHEYYHRLGVIKPNFLFFPVLLYCRRHIPTFLFHFQDPFSKRTIDISRTEAEIGN